MAVKTVTLGDKNFDISYEIVNPSAKEDIVILHGWGSNKEIMKNSFAKYLKNFRHIYIDMPGFGKSETQYVLTTEDYKDIMLKTLEVLNSNYKTVVGHSFGGKVATLMQPSNIALLSTAGILEEKPFSVKAKIFFAKLFNTLGLGAITKAFRSKDVDNMSENMYATFKNVVDEDFTEKFAKFPNKALVFWGEEDRAVSLASGKKIAHLIRESTFNSYKGDHYFFCKHAEDIAKKIEDGIL